MGKYTANGTREDPFSLKAAPLSPDIIRPGDRLWLLGGIYEAPGHKEHPLPSLVRHQEPPPDPDLGKKAAAGNVGVAADAELFDEPLDDLLQDAGPKKQEKPKRPTTVMRHYFTSILAGTPERPVIVRACPGESVTIHGGLKIKGGFTWYWGFEIAEPEERANSRGVGSHVTVYAPGIRLINLDLHGGNAGVTMGGSLYDSEMYGCIMHDFGYWPEVPPYAENFSPGRGLTMESRYAVKRISDNIVFRGFGHSFYGPTADYLCGIRMEGNMIFGAGMKHNDYATANVYFGWHYASYRIFLVDNVFYHPSARSENVRSVGFNFWRVSGEFVMRGNIFSGGNPPLLLGMLNSLHMTGNVFRSTGAFMRIESQLLRDGSEWDNNTYVCLNDESGRADTKRFQFENGRHDLASWRKMMRVDANSRLLEGKDIDTRVIVRPNMYEPGRAHVAVIPWGKKQAVPADLAPALKKGVRFAIYNVQGMDKPVVEGTFDGKPVMLPRGNTSLAPDFDAYLVVTVH